jgi:hypothetical protein
MNLQNTWLMRRSLPVLLPLLGTLSLACGGSGSTANTGGGSGTGTEATTTGTETASSASSASSGTGAGGMMMAGAIPDPGPGNQVDQDFTEKEPNDTPETATPLGTAMGSVNVWVTSNKLGGSADAADYFVFKSGPAAGTMTLNICFSAPITEMTATLWKVVNAKAELPPIGTWTSVATCIQGPPMGAPLDADSTYLFELTAKGEVATYNA